MRRARADSANSAGDGLDRRRELLHGGKVRDSLYPYTRRPLAHAERRQGVGRPRVKEQVRGIAGSTAN
jgi:hypothetical protein